jgi:uncharacterized protein
MQINLEAAEKRAVQAYDEKRIQIDSIIYESSLIVSRNELISEVAIKKIGDMDEEYLQLLIQSKPELIIIGHEEPGVFPPFSLLSQLSKMRIGIECMSIGAACRTYNVLLSEDRFVVAGFIF